MTIKLTDDDIEDIKEAVSSGLSSCCGAKVYNPSGKKGEGTAICTECKEPCDEINED